MFRHGLLGLGALSLMVFGQIDGTTTPIERWVTTTGAFGLCVFMVVRFSAAIEKLTVAITALRVHCASKIGQPKNSEQDPMT